MTTKPELDEAGNATVFWCLLVALMLLPLGGLSTDLWRGIAVQRQLQAAAEDAAAAGASGIDVAAYRQTGCLVLDPSLAVALAESNLRSQIGLVPLAGESVQLGPGATDISVYLTKDIPFTLLRWVEGDRPFVIRASATSAPRGSAPKAGCP